MVKIESFSSLSKPQDDLFKKGFVFANHFGVHYKDKGETDFTYRISGKNVQVGSVSSFLLGYWAEKKFSNGFTFREDFDATQTFKAALEYIPPADKNLKVKGEISTVVAPDSVLTPTVTAEYTLENAKLKLAATKGPVVKATAVTGVENFGVGVDLAYNWATHKLTTYNAALYYIEPTYRLVLKHLSDSKAAAVKAGNVALTAFFDINSDLKVGGEVVYNTSTKKPEAQVAVQNVFNEFHTGKLRIKDSGEVATSFKHRLNSNVLLTTSSSFSFKSLSAWPLFQFGFKLSLTS